MKDKMGSVIFVRFPCHRHSALEGGKKWAKETAAADAARSGEEPTAKSGQRKSKKNRNHK
jgi:hypothetical protein